MHEEDKPSESSDAKAHQSEKKVTLDELIKKCDATAPLVFTQEDLNWLNSPRVGKEML